MKNIQITDIRANKSDSAFLVDDGKTAILYDSGFAFTGFAVADHIKALLKGRSLDAIFLTHSHYDHALGAAYVLQYWPNAKVVAGEYAAKIFAKPTAKAVMRDLDRKFAHRCGIDDYEDLIDQLRVDIPASDGDTIRIGDMEFIVLNLPGHTKCSVGFYNPAEKLLLSCETLGVYNGSDDVVPSYLVGYQMTLDAIDRVASLDIERILLPHFGVLEGEQVRFYLKKAKESAVTTADEILAMLRQGLNKERIAAWFKERFYHGYVVEIYPVDAMELNTGITIDLLARELMPQA